MLHLRDYQKDCLNKLYRSLKSNRKVLLSLPTGAGKTIMMYSWAQKMAQKGLRTVVVVDRVELVQQTFALDSQISVLKANSQYKFDPNSLIHIVMLQTGFRRESQLLDLNADFVFFDEIHQYVNGKMFTALCDCMPKAKIIGVTATPIDDRGYLLEGFDDYIGDLQTNDLIDLGYLVKPVHYVPADYNLDLSTVRMSNGDYNVEDLDSIMIDHNRLENVYQQWLSVGKGHRTIAFCSSIKQAEATCHYFYNRGINCCCVHSNISLEKRQACLSDLKAGVLDIVFNVGILVAGFDEPTVDCIMFLNPTRILRRYLQQAGRGLRIADGKRQCLMLDCADVVRQHGFCNDLRFYKQKPQGNDDCELKDCPECGAIVSRSTKVCPYCGYDFSAEPSIKGKMPKKKLQQLTKAMSMQAELKQQIAELVSERGYKSGYKWYLFIDCLKSKKASESSIQFFKRKLSKIKKIKKYKWKLASLQYN